MNRLKKTPFFLFLLPVFFSLHGALEIYGSIYFLELCILGLGICIGMALLYSAIYFFTKSPKIASLITFYISLLYIFFGALQDWIQGKAFLSVMHRYSVLLPVLGVSIVCLMYLLKKNTAIHKKLFLYLNVLLILYCLLDTVMLLNKSANTKEKAWANISFDLSKVKAKPNVYYLLFDEYPGYKTLKAEFGFANDSLYNFFKNKGFTILPSVSTYNFTLFSMSSIFNMQYIDSNYNHEHEMTDLGDFRKRFLEIKHGEVFSLYKSMGYQIENYSIFDVGDLACINTDKSFLPIHAKALKTKMLHHRLIKDVGWWFNGTMLQNIFTSKEAIYYADETNRDINNAINKSLAQKSNKPKFCYAHFVMPHAPYFRDSSGAFIRNEKGQIVTPTDTQYFLPYLKYTNAYISSLVNKIVQEDSSAIIVVMSDHGFRDYSNNKAFRLSAFDNICAVRFTNNNLPPYTDSLSSVNFFRYLFNSEYGQQIPYIKDSTIWVNY